MNDGYYRILIRPDVRHSLLVVQGRGKGLSVVADAEIELLYGDGANWSGCCERAIVTFGGMLLLRLLQFCPGSK